MRLSIGGSGGGVGVRIQMSGLLRKLRLLHLSRQRGLSGGRLRRSRDQTRSRSQIRSRVDVLREAVMERRGIGRGEGWEETGERRRRSGIDFKESSEKQEEEERAEEEEGEGQ